jgi:hypothetical protein
MLTLLSRCQTEDRVTDLQDEICDRLVGQNISPNWIGGPLHVAILVIDPKFVPATRGDTRPGQFARAIGWPVTFCEAVTGANAVLANVDERRALAISLFSRVPPVSPGKAVLMSAKVSHPAAEWAVLRGHELACGVDCPLHEEVVAASEALAAGGKWRNPFFRAGRSDCRTAPRKHDKPVKRDSSAAHHAVVAIRYLNLVKVNSNSSHALADAMRESAKAVTKVGGLEEAVVFCLALAEKLRLTATRPSAGGD